MRELAGREEERVHACVVDEEQGHGARGQNGRKGSGDCELTRANLLGLGLTLTDDKKKKRRL